MTELEGIRMMGKGLVARKSKFPGGLKPRKRTNSYGVDERDGWMIGWMIGWGILPFQGRSGKVAVPPAAGRIQPLQH